jgi:hypothetical protein
MSKPNHGGYVKGLCGGIPKKLGQEFVMGRVLIQQQLPRESNDFEVLYRCRCHTPLNWIEPREKVIFGPNLVEETEATIGRIQENLRAAKSCQESYANKWCRPLEFAVRDHVYLKVSPMKDMKRFGMKGKLPPRYIGQFRILEKCGNVAYKLELKPSLAGVHNIFYVP